MRQEISRRAFLSRSASAAAIVGTSAIPAAAVVRAQSGLSETVNAFFAHFIAAHSEIARLKNEFDAACAALPDWVRPGPKYINAKGGYEGVVVGWPRDDSVSPPDKIEYWRMSRPSFDDVWDPPTRKYLEEDFSPVMARKHRLRRFARVRAWIARKRKADAARQAAGLPAITAALDEQEDIAGRLEARILGMLDRTGNPTLIAARIMVEMIHEGNSADSASAFLRLLDSVVDQTDGVVRTHAEEMLAGSIALEAQMDGKA